MESEFDFILLDRKAIAGKPCLEEGPRKTFQKG